MSTPSKIVVLGSNSFSGASFVDYALEKGCDVIGISRSREPHRAFLPYRWNKKSNHFRFHALDVNLNLDEILNLIKKEKPSHIVNFAAQSLW